MPEDERSPTSETLTPKTLRLLAEAPFEVVGRMPWSSNGTFLVEVDGGDDADPLRAIYKPQAAERPLRDFPRGLHRREVAAFALDELLGFGLVPPTVLRTDGPLGEGSLQRFVEADFSVHYFDLVGDPRYRDALRRMALFDLVANNADRKAGHCLLAADGRVFGIDHGLCFHRLPKLRTVIWELGGEPIPDDERAAILRAADGAEEVLGGLLEPYELDALEQRAVAVSELDCLPDVEEEWRPYPWPLI